MSQLCSDLDTLSTLRINVSLNGFGYTDYTWVPLIGFDILILHDHLVSFLEFIFSMPCVPSIVLIYLCVGTVVAMITHIAPIYLNISSDVGTLCVLHWQTSFYTAIEFRYQNYTGHVKYCVTNRTDNLKFLEIDFEFAHYSFILSCIG